MVRSLHAPSFSSEWKTFPQILQLTFLDISWARTRAHAPHSSSAQTQSLAEGSENLVIVSN